MSFAVLVQVLHRLCCAHSWCNRQTGERRVRTKLLSLSNIMSRRSNIWIILRVTNVFTGSGVCTSSSSMSTQLSSRTCSSLCGGTMKNLLMSTPPVAAWIWTQLTPHGFFSEVSWWSRSVAKMRVINHLGSNGWSTNNGFALMVDLCLSVCLPDFRMSKNFPFPMARFCTRTSSNQPKFHC